LRRFTYVYASEGEYRMKANKQSNKADEHTIFDMVMKEIKGKGRNLYIG